MTLVLDGSCTVCGLDMVGKGIRCCVTCKPVYIQRLRDAGMEQCPITFGFEDLQRLMRSGAPIEPIDTALFGPPEWIRVASNIPSEWSLAIIAKRLASGESFDARLHATWALGHEKAVRALGRTLAYGRP